MNINLLSAFNSEAKENNPSFTIMNDTTDTTTSAEEQVSTSRRKRSRAVPERSTLELTIANLLPLPDKGGRRVICCLDFGINYYKRQGK